MTEVTAVSVSRYKMITPRVMFMVRVGLPSSYIYYKPFYISVSLQRSGALWEISVRRFDLSLPWL